MSNEEVLSHLGVIRSLLLRDGIAVASQENLDRADRQAIAALSQLITTLEFEHPSDASESSSGPWVKVSYTPTASSPVSGQSGQINLTHPKILARALDGLDRVVKVLWMPAEIPQWQFRQLAYDLGFVRGELAAALAEAPPGPNDGASAIPEGSAATNNRNASASPSA